MAENLGVAVLELKADGKGFSTGLKTAEAEAKGFTSRAGSMFASFGKAGLAGAAVAGIGALTAAIKIGIDEFSESAKVQAQTAAVLKSTGGAAGVTAKQVSSLANEILNYSGIDDEAVQSGENLLLTFRNVRDAVGKGNDIFSQATKTMADMSVALGQDMKTSAIQLGKALNDPVRGVTALQRVGVSFTKAQREQIKALVDSGQTMKAQKVILAELTKEFGGSAKAVGDTLPGKISILHEKFNNAMGDMVGAANKWMQLHWDDISEALKTMGETWRSVGQIVGQVINFLRPVIEVFFKNWMSQLKILSDILHGDFGAALDEWKSMFTRTLSGIGAMFDQVFGGVASKIAGFATAAATAAENFGKGILDGAIKGMTGLADWISGRIQAGITAITNAAAGALQAATAFGAAILAGLKAGITGFADWVWTRATGAVAYLVSEAANALREATAFGAKILSGLKAGITGFADFVWTRATGAIAYIGQELTNAYNAALGFGSRILSGMKDGIVGFANWVAGRAAAAVQFIKDKAQDAYDAAKGFGGRILKGIQDGVGAIASWVAGQINSVIDIVNGLISAFNSLPFVPNIPTIGHVGGGGPPFPESGTSGPASTPGRALGGPVEALRPYVVGERGPELFVPGSSGAIVPKLGRVGGDLHVHVTVPGTLVGSGGMDELAERIRASLRRYGKNNGVDALAY